MIVNLRPIQAEELQLRINRWLSLTEVSGNVSYLQGLSTLPANLGLRLQAVGDGVRTGKASRALLQLDNGIGQIEVRERTTLRVAWLKMAPEGGRVTRLRLEAGNIRLRLHPLKDPSSVFELETPTGVSAVRGTDFSVVVHPDGQSGVVVQEGRVSLSAQQTSVLLEAKQQGVMAVGRAPRILSYASPPPFLQLRQMTWLGRHWAQITAMTDPMNLVTLNDESRSIRESGCFEIVLPASRPFPSDPRGSRAKRLTGSPQAPSQVQIQVTTPLGERRYYAISAP